MLRSWPLILAASLPGCLDEILNPVDTGSGGSYEGTGGNIATADCKRNNPGPEISGAEVKHYPVEGETLPKVVESLTHFKTGEISASSTECIFALSYRIGQITYIDVSSPYPNYCTEMWVDSAKVDPRVVVSMPRWNGCDPCWDSYLDVLGVHEQGHADACYGSAKELEEKVLKIEILVCWPWKKEESMTMARGQFNDNLEATILEAQSAYLEHTESYDQAGHQAAQEYVLSCK